MESQFRRNGLSAVRFNAVDGSDLAFDQVERLNSNARRPLTNGELGCALSHIGVWQVALENEWKYTWIFEDDVNFQLSTEAIQNFLSNMDQVAPDWCLLYVKDHSSTSFFYQVCNREHIEPELSPDAPVTDKKIRGDLYKVGPQIGTYSYIVSQRGIRMCLEHFKTILNPVDVQLGQLNDIMPTFLWMNPLARLEHDGISDTRS